MADAMGTEISGEMTSTEDAEARDSEEEDEAKNPLSFSNTEGGPGYDAQFATVLSSLLVRDPKRRRGMAEAKEEIDRF